jgi:uncharacterized protein YukE
MTDNERFELKADAFCRITGYMAPGKDAWQGPSYQERLKAWEQWNSNNSTIIDAMILSFEYLFPDGKEGEG